MEEINEEYVALAGETSWVGTGFVALKIKETNSIKWLTHLSRMNNPIVVRIETENIIVITDLHYPNGIDVIIPISRPGDFKIEVLKT